MRIGLQQTMYSVSDSVEYQAVCAEVLSGSISGREIEISYTTAGGKAQSHTKYTQPDIQGDVYVTTFF